MKIIPIGIALALLAICSINVRGQSTAFTYQGNLKRGDIALNGVHEMSFALFDAEMGGQLLGTTVATVSVTNSLFTVLLDFGGAVFGSTNRWIEIGVRATGEILFSTLAPRQQLTPTPFAILANTVAPNSITADKLAPGAVTSLSTPNGGPLNVLTISSNGNVGVGTMTPASKFEVNGTMRTKVLEITGADLAERFPMIESVAPGMVVAIDVHQPGKLCRSRGAYNRRVAGVVSGANDFSVGAVLGNFPGNENAPPVASSGRVYVWCDASTGPIQPGDLLTTSETPGHAMKVANFERAQGAILGKAMTALESGTGMVLALVTLQ